MRIGRGNEIGYVETQLMIPRGKRGEDHIITTPGPTPGGDCGIVHAMWGYTYEIPNFTDTVFGDPTYDDLGELGEYWQFIIPVTTMVDRVSFIIPPAFPIGIAGFASFGLYDLNIAATSAPRVAVSDKIPTLGLTVGSHTLDLDSRVTLDPGMYAMSYVAPCFDLVCINANTDIFDMINALWEPFHRYGAFHTSNFDHPDTIDTTNILPGVPDPPTNYFPYQVPVPLIYFDDSQEFT